MTRSRGIRPVRRAWTDEEIETVRINYADHATYVIAYLVDRTEGSVHQLAQKLGLRKSAAFLASDRSERVQRGKQDPAMRATQFKPGQVPANKGLRRPGWAPGRMADGQFKKGRKPEEARNYRPVGSERYDEKRGVVIRKVTDDTSIYPAARWQPVHRLVWEAVHGAAPEGHLVVFRPGMKTLDSSLITIDRLELVTHAEQMRRNSYHTRYPKEVGQLIQLKGALNRKINRRNREREEQDQRRA